MPEEGEHSVGNRQVKGGELGEANLKETKWEDKEPGRTQGERKGKGGKKSMRNKIGTGVSKGRKNPSKNSGNSKKRF